MPSAGTNSFKTYEAVGNREDLSDIISNISPTDTPFVSRAGKTKADATYHEWQTDELAAPAANAHLESEEADIAQSSPTTRLGNYTQIFQKTCSVSGTQEVVRKAGRASEMAYQMIKRGKELNKDIELAMLSNQAKSAGDASNARKLRGLPSWIATNLNAGAGASAGDATHAFTPGTPRALTEDMVMDVIQKGYENGANFDAIMVAPAVKVIISKTFGGTGDRVTQYRQQTSKTAGTTIAVYQSDFGNFDIIPNRVMHNATGGLDLQKYLFLIDFSMVSVATLRPVKSVTLAKTGDNEKRMLVTEKTLVVKNEKGLGMVADIDVTADYNTKSTAVTATITSSAAAPIYTSAAVSNESLPVTVTSSAGSPVYTSTVVSNTTDNPVPTQAVTAS